MKRLFFILFFFSVLLCSCQKSEELLEYQSKNVRAECIVNQEYKVVIEKAGELCSVSIMEPDYAKGISFTIGDVVSASWGDGEIELDKSLLDGICAIGGLFSQREECLTGAVQAEGGSVLTFSDGDCTYKISLGKNSLPKEARIVSPRFEYEIHIVSIELG